MKVSIILTIALLLTGCGSVYQNIAGSYASTKDSTEIVVLKDDKTFTSTVNNGISGTYSVSGNTITFVCPGVVLNTATFSGSGSSTVLSSNGTDYRRN